MAPKETEGEKNSSFPRAVKIGLSGTNLEFSEYLAQELRGKKSHFPNLKAQVSNPPLSVHRINYLWICGGSTNGTQCVNLYISEEHETLSTLSFGYLRSQKCKCWCTSHQRCPWNHPTHFGDSGPPLTPTPCLPALSTAFSNQYVLQHKPVKLLLLEAPLCLEKRT